MISAMHMDDIEASLTDEAKRVMLHLILSWARLDAALTHYLLIVTGVSYDNGSILIGRMDTRAKIEKLKSIYQHHAMEDAASSISNLAILHKRYVNSRNAIAHYHCVGTERADPKTVVFLTGSISKGIKGSTAGKTFTLEHMAASADFAHRAASMLRGKMPKGQWKPSKPPPEPPSFEIQNHPNPQKSGKRKRDKPPPPSPA